jgi:hypothetical protein
MHNPCFTNSCMDGVVVLWEKRGLCIEHGINDHSLFSANSFSNSGHSDNHI